jgi:hypothetical protein
MMIQTGANRALEQLSQALQQLKLEPVIERATLARVPIAGQQEPVQVLIVELDTRRVTGNFNSYMNATALHQIGTMLGGVPVTSHNSNGVRYVVLLSGRPKLARSVDWSDDLIEADVFHLGMGIWGTVSVHAGIMQNVILGGAQGTGKSTMINLLLYQALQHGYTVYLADPQAHTFNPDLWDSLAAAPVATSPEDFQALIATVIVEIQRRSTVFREAAHLNRGMVPKDIDQYNAISPERLPRIVLFADEANTFFDHGNVFEELTRLAREGRKWGVHLVLAAHNWRSKDVPRSLSGMFPTRIAFKVHDDTGGGVILGNRMWGRRAQAISHGQKGRCIALAEGRFQHLQGYYLPDEWLIESVRESVQSRPLLSEIEIELVAYALRENEGKFTIGTLVQAFADREAGPGQRVTSHWLNTKVAQKWEAWGWLTSPQNAVDARRVTAELARKAGLEPGEFACLRARLCL